MALSFRQFDWIKSLTAQSASIGMLHFEPTVPGGKGSLQILPGQIGLFFQI
jgi:hypothetical protein